MKVNVVDVRFEPAGGGDNITVNTTLKPGACVDVLPLEPGDYAMRFNEHGPNGEAAMCARRVTVKPGDTLRISPDDGAQCVQ